MKSESDKRSELREDNLVAHKKEGTSDKVYMACFREEADVSGNTTYTVIGKWGRRGQALKSQVKWTGINWSQARDMLVDLFNSKLNEGYVDIDSSGYRASMSNPVTRMESPIAASLELNRSKLITQSELAMNVLPIESDRMLKDGDEVTCINNIGIEDKFDLGIDYVSDTHTDKQMIWVYDKNGERGEFFVDRFRKV